MWWVKEGETGRTVEGHGEVETPRDRTEGDEYPTRRPNPRRVGQTQGGNDTSTGAPETTTNTERDNDWAGERQSVERVTDRDQDRSPVGTRGYTFPRATTPLSRLLTVSALRVPPDLSPFPSRPRPTLRPQYVHCTLPTLLSEPYRGDPVHQRDLPLRLLPDHGSRGESGVGRETGCHCA